MGSCAACAAIFYGACLPTAGCAASDEMISCVDELMELDCQDMSVCGNDCTLEDGDPVSEDDRFWLVLASVEMCNTARRLVAPFPCLHTYSYCLPDVGRLQQQGGVLKKMSREYSGSGNRPRLFVRRLFLAPNS